MAQGTEGVDWVTTTEAIVDTDRNRIVYPAGSRVPMDDAVKYGLVEKRAKRGPAEDRAQKSAEDRTITSKSAVPVKRVRKRR